MTLKVDVAIIGAGSAGISAFKEAKKKTKSVVIIDHGPIGTTCARVGCMPSKLLIQAADFFHQRHYYKERGIHGGDQLTVNMKEVMQYVRKMRDYFTKGMVSYTEKLGKDFIKGSASFLEPDTLQVGSQTIKAKKIIIATGGLPFIPDDWQSFKNDIITSNNIFEQEDFSKNMAVIGAGIIGLEMGQALFRLGVDIQMFHATSMLGIITDPVINEVAIKLFNQAFPLYIDEKASVTKEENCFKVKSDNYHFKAEQLLAATGRKPALNELGLEKLGIDLSHKTIPEYQPGTKQLDKLPIFIVGDANNKRPLLHEAIDEGRIAGFNATSEENHCFEHRTPLAIIFTDPNIASVGKAYKELDQDQIVIGEIDYSEQGRARIMAANKGMLRVYADKQTGVLLGAEMIAPGGEHLAHLLAWSIQSELTVHQALQMPFYHPVLEEGLRTALRDAASKLKKQTASHFELAICDSSAPGVLG